VTPTIDTPRLVLMPYRAGMVTYQEIGWLNNKGLMKYSEQRHHVHTIMSQHEYLNRFPVNSHIWLVCLKDDEPGLIPRIGTISAHIDPFNKTANMGVLIGNHAGCGYGTEAWKRVMDFLFEWGTEKIEAGMMQTNEPMMAVCKKTGMAMEGIKPKHFLVDNKRVDLVQYGVWR